MMNILIIGLGSIARKHIAALNSLRLEFKLYALRSDERAQNHNNITNIYSLDNLDVKIDFAIISNPTHLHYSFIEALAIKGIDLFIEKPPVDSIGNLNELSTVLEVKGIKNYIACNLRFHPCIRFMKDFLSKEGGKRINEVNIYCGSYLPDWRPDVNFREVYSARAEMGGGVHLDLYHELDYTYWMFGKPKNSKSTKRTTSSLNIDSIDYANYIFEYEYFAANIVLNYYRRDAKRTIEILFEDETFTIDMIDNHIKNSKGETVFSLANFKITDTYKLQMEYFIKCLSDNQEPMNTFTESIEVLKICLKND